MAPSFTLGAGMSLRHGAVLFAATLALAACSLADRGAAVPAGAGRRAVIPGIPNARSYGTELAPLLAEFQAGYTREAAYFRTVGRALPPANYLALSGGGDNGAFGAGLLVGWTERGSRPTFQSVSGGSTGALIAPFAFLGSRYDPQLTEVYTTIDQTDIFVKRPFVAAIAADAMTDTTPLQKLIARYFDEAMREAIAREYGRGRLLFVITTDLDAGKPVIWNIGAIAASGHPDAVDLIRRVLLASVSIPAAFPPVMFDVTLDGLSYSELHVDGAAFVQTFLYPPWVALGKLPGIGNRRRTAFLIRNGKIHEDWNETERRTLPIATRPVSTLITGNSLGDLYRIYAVTKRDGVDFNLGYIEDDFDEPHPDQFDRAYMNKLFEYARAKARVGYRWRKGPPGFAD